MIQNITNNDEHLKTCFTTQYSGLSHEGKSSFSEAIVKYKFALPLKAKALHHEYFIIDSIELIGSVGGTLGMFIGFSFSNLIISVIHYIQSMTERRFGTHLTLWKCLEWMIYLSFMATAILFTMKVIEKFFGQYTDVKQNTEKIQSHPTITICPFQEQCVKPVPNEIFVKLNGEVKDVHSSKEGSYILGTNLVNGKAYWIHNDSNAIWCDKGYGYWFIGKIENLGSSKASMYSPDDSVGPLESTYWIYSNDGWHGSTDVAIQPGI